MAGSYTDKELSCVDCGTGFTFTSGEQERFAQLGFTNEPKRCAPCRAAKKAAGGGGRGGGNRDDARGRSGPREMHPAKCGACGANCEVPFKPRGDRPVYCSDCFNKQR